MNALLRFLSLRWLACALLLGLMPGLAEAATPARSTAPAAGATAAPPMAALTPDQARQALDVLNDPHKRAEFAALLEALARGTPPAEGKTAATAATPTTAGTANPAGGAATAKAGAGKPPLPLAPNSLGAEVLVGASSFLDRQSQRALAMLRTVHSVPLLWGWVVVMATDPWAQTMLIASAWRLALALALGMAVEWLLRRALRRTFEALEARAPRIAKLHHADDPVPPPATAEARAEHGETEPPAPPRRRPTPWMLLRRVPLVLGRLGLDLLPVLALGAIGHAFAASPLGGDPQTQLVILAGIDAYVLSSVILAVARMMVSPDTPRLRLVHLSSSQAAYIMRWLRRMVVVSVVGYAAAEVGLLFGMSDAAHVAVMKAVALFDHVSLAIIVLQKRRVVRNWIRGHSDKPSLWNTLRRRLGAIWHWIALFYLIALWLVWAVEIQHGYTAMLRFFVVTCAVLLLARLAQIALTGALDRCLRLDPALLAQHPGLDARVALYQPLLQAVLRFVVVAIAIVLLLQVWGLGALDWFVASSLGLRLLSGVVSLGLTILIALAIWELANIAAQRHLARLTRDAQAARSARLRTLLPLLRTGLMVCIVVVAGLIVLSEIGLNIAPLLAGAGIIGVAIGFGSQKLVQDLITGIFLLLENAMQVGDFVTVSGLGGTVEALSVRTIRLRASDGSVHIIPFSAVTSVTNTNRGLGNAAVSAVLDYSADTDRACEVLREIGAEMRKDEAFSLRILGDLAIWGVDKVDGASVTILGQIPCTDSGRWAVQREFNRRMKLRFQQEGISLYNPSSQEIALRRVAPVNASAKPAAEGSSAPGEGA